MVGRRTRAALLAALAPAICACSQHGAVALLASGAVPPDQAAERPADGAEDSGAPQRPPDRRQPDVREVPEVFAAAGEVVWDGMPTLAGLWVAHPATSVARRVRMWNMTTGTVVDGALLPRRGGGSASDIVVSAEAAEALGIEPSVPATLQLVALERDETVREPAAGATPEAEDVATAAAPVQPPAAVPDGQAVPAVVAAAEPSAVAAVAALLGRTPETPAAPAAPEAPAAAAVPADPAAVADLAALVAGPPAAAASEPPPDMSAAPPPSVERSVPDASAPPPTVGDPAAAAGPGRPAAVATAPSATAQESPAVDVPAPASGAPAEQTPPIADGKPYVQAGYFAEPEHAADLVRTLAREGIPAENSEETVRGTALHRVRAGPFATAAARDRALQKLRAIGIADAVAAER